jgi:hypothetical protein
MKQSPLFSLFDLFRRQAAHAGHRWLLALCVESQLHCSPRWPLSTHLRLCLLWFAAPRTVMPFCLPHQTDGGPAHPNKVRVLALEQREKKRNCCVHSSIALGGVALLQTSKLLDLDSFWLEYDKPRWQHPLFSIQWHKCEAALAPSGMVKAQRKARFGRFDVNTDPYRILINFDPFTCVASAEKEASERTRTRIGG